MKTRTWEGKEYKILIDKEIVPFSQPYTIDKKIKVLVRKSLTKGKKDVIL